MDPLTMYELCVQSPGHVAGFLAAVHGGSPIVLHEDFGGTGAVSRRWLADGLKRSRPRRAVVTDLDQRALDYASGHALAAGIRGSIDLRCENCLCITRESHGFADAVFVGNFSLGYIHTRPALVRYLAACKARLNPGGVFVCDTYGGASAFALGGHERRHYGPAGEIVHYCWTHEAADPLTGMVENAISFRLEIDGEIVRQWPRAFTYRWRLWSIAELREAMAEAGLTNTSVYAECAGDDFSPPSPIEHARDLGEDWILLVVGR